MDAQRHCALATIHLIHVNNMVCLNFEKMGFIFIFTDERFLKLLEGETLLSPESSLCGVVSSVADNCYCVKIKIACHTLLAHLVIVRGSVPHEACGPVCSPGS